MLPSLTDILSCHFRRDFSTNKLLYALLFFPARLRSQHTSLWISSLYIHVFRLILSLVFLLSNLLFVPKIKSTFHSNAIRKEEPPIRDNYSILGRNHTACAMSGPLPVNHFTLSCYSIIMLVIRSPT